MVSRRRRDFEAAESWCRKSLVIFEKHEDEFASAGTHVELGIIAGMRGRYEDSAAFLIRSLIVFARALDNMSSQLCVRNLGISYSRASLPERARIKALWLEADLGPFPIPEEPGG